MPNNTLVLQVENVVKHYGSRGSMTKALNGVNLAMNRGEFVGVMGPSGSGKTTLLNLVATIDIPTKGRILIDDQDLSRLNKRQLARFRREQLGFIFQEFNLLDTLTLRENIALPLTISGTSQRGIEARVNVIAQRLGIVSELDRFPYQVSGGQKQRAAAARALIGNPTLVLADEPTGALDSKSSQMLLQAMSELNQELFATILMVTHDPFAASYCQRILFIKDGTNFTELVRGDDPRQAFFDRILEVMAQLGGDARDVR